MPVNVSNRFVSHRINLFEPDLLFSINCLSFNPNETQVAVLRRILPVNEKLQPKSPLVSLTLIEVWNCNGDHRLTLGQTIYDDEDDPCLLESLGWSYDNRLWACGLNGRLHEVNLINNNMNQGYPLISGAGWCLKFCKSRMLVAVGTEEGYICIFNVSVTGQDGSDINFVKTLNRDQGRIMSLAWYEPPNECKQIVSGSIGAIKIWNYESGSCLSVIKASDDATIFWCLTIIDDFTIVSGDSNGNTVFWDGRRSTLINSIPSHKSDVLCLTQVEGKKCLLYSAGVDPSVVTFSVDSNGKGVQAETLNLHRHDVRSLAFSKEWLISGGIDGYLTQVCAHPYKQIHQAPVFHHLVNVDQNHILFQLSRSLQIWEIGSAAKNITENTDPDVLDLRSPAHISLITKPKKIVDISTKRLIHCSNFSGPWIGYSTLEKFKLFHLSEGNLTKVPMLCTPIYEVITGINFVDNKYILLSTGLKIFVFQLLINGIVLKKKLKYKQRVSKMSSCGIYVALLLDDCSVLVLNIEDWSLTRRFKLAHLPTCLTFNPYQKNYLWFTFHNHLVMSYSVETNEFFKYAHNEPNQDYPLIGITFYPCGFIAYDQDRMYSFFESSWKTTDRYSHLAKVEYLTEKNELIVIEVTPEMIAQNIPIRFSKKKFRS